MDSADHSQFQFAAERYVLGELSEPETLAFEEHFFSCASCAQDVEDLTAIRQVAPSVLPELERTAGPTPKQASRGWFALPWVPQFALGAFALLAMLAGYQNAVEIPRLKAVGQEDLQLSALPHILSASRSAGTTSLSIQQRAAPLLIANEWPEQFSRYEAKIARSGSAEQTLRAEAAVGDGSLLVLVPASRLGAGTFELTIFGVREGAEPQIVARYPFTIQGKHEQ